MTRAGRRAATFGLWWCVVAALAAFFALASGGAPDARAADERILNFVSRIDIADDGTVMVREEITVRALGKDIKRGIYRDFPTTYRDNFGNTVRVGFELVSVKRDGRFEPNHIENRANGVRIYAGEKNVFLDPGEYTYTFTYTVQHALGFFDDYDELYWNVTGNGWSFPIDRAEARVRLPPGATLVQQAAYTGPQGAQGRNYTFRRASSGELVFTTTQTLAPGEGLTIAVAWPKGIVPEPTTMDKAGRLLSENRSGMIGMIGLVVALIYYAIAWHLVGRDPEKWTIVPLFEPPKGFSPAGARYVNRMGFDNKAVGAAVIDMAVKGYLEIEDDDGDYALTLKNRDAEGLSPGERKLGNKLFSAGSRIKLKKKNHKTMQAAVKALKTSLKLEYEKNHFRTNSAWIIPGIAISVLTLAGVVLAASEIPPAAFMVVWLSFWTIGCIGLVAAAYKAIKSAFSGGSKGQAIVLPLFALPFLAGEVGGFIFFAMSTSVLAALSLLLLVGALVAFIQLIKAPTFGGRRIMDELEGFKLYLSTAEQHRLNELNPPDKTPQLFERFLPYALALDVENEWCEQFASLWSIPPEQGGYHPHWYHGRHMSGLHSGAFASSLGSSFTDAISSSSKAPGSSSGSGGGGSSGGGGGGGGGGGW